METPDVQPAVDPPTPPWWLLGAIALCLIAGSWYGMRMFTTDVTRACVAGYDAARTAADSTAIDSMVPDTTRPGRTCGMRRTNRWRGGG